MQTVHAHIATALDYPRRSLLYGLTAMALAARIHATDEAVMKTGFRVLKQIDPKYQQIILNIMNSPSPLMHMSGFIATLPDHILTGGNSAQKLGQ